MLLFNLNYEAKKCLLHQGRFMYIQLSFCATTVQRGFRAFMLVCTTLESLTIIGARGRNRTGTPLRARDFKSLVSTNFTTRADSRSTTNCGAYSNTLVCIFLSKK